MILRDTEHNTMANFGSSATANEFEAKGRKKL